LPANPTEPNGKAKVFFHGLADRRNQAFLERALGTVGIPVGLFGIANDLDVLPRAIFQRTGTDRAKQGREFDPRLLSSSARPSSWRADRAASLGRPAHQKGYKRFSDGEHQ
jgi:hypothetical protein